MKLEENDELTHVLNAGLALAEKARQLPTRSGGNWHDWRELDGLAQKFEALVSAMAGNEEAK